jgi:hypothetical protein
VTVLILSSSSSSSSLLSSLSSTAALFGNNLHLVRHKLQVAHRRHIYNSWLTSNVSTNMICRFLYDLRPYRILHINPSIH